MNRIFLILLTISVITLIVWALQKQKLKSHEILPALFILSGAIGNVIDRIFLGSVTDFIAVWKFPIFNVADICITIGLVLWIWKEIEIKKSAQS